MLTNRLYQIICLAINPFRLLYIYVRNPKTVATPVRIYIYIYVHGLCDIEIWGFNWRLTDNLRYHHTRCSRASGLLAAITKHVYQFGRKSEFTRRFRHFSPVLENYDCRTKFNSSLGMEYHGELYGFSAVKVKLVDSLI